jgi:hypothetical protein
MDDQEEKRARILADEAARAEAARIERAAKPDAEGHKPPLPRPRPYRPRGRPPKREMGPS